MRRASSLFFSATFLKFIVVGTFNTLNGTFLAWLYSLFLQPNVAFVVGYAVIAWLLRYISTHNFTVFVWYRLGLAAVVAVLIMTGVLAA